MYKDNGTRCFGAIWHAMLVREITGAIECEPGPQQIVFGIIFRQKNGFFLTRDELTASYAIILHNVRTYHSAGVLAIIKGRQNAESALKNFEDAQGSSDRHEGWRYFIEKTDLKPGIGPREATELRQAKLEMRESKALQEATTPNVLSPDPKR